MFDCFINFSNNAHHICCEDSLAKGPYNLFLVNDLDLQSRSQLRLKVDNVFSLYFNSNISDNISAMALKLGMAVDMHGIHTHAHSHDPDLDFAHV